MKKIGICGHFGGKHHIRNGQIVKTENITSELERIYGKDGVMTVDTYGGIRHLPILVIKLINLMRCCENVIILPAQNGVRVIAPLCVILNVMLRRKLHYVVIGGWLPRMLADRKRLAKYIRKFTGVYVETTPMQDALECMGFQNIFVMPNFKDIHILDESETTHSRHEPYLLCTFSRVMKEKGIEDAVRVVQRVNEEEKRTVFTLDIYGQIDSEQVEWFETLKKTFPEYISYKGVAEASESVEYVRKYDALLFPTRFYSEGIPGTIIDAYSSGVPVICSKWESFADIVEDGSTGIGYEFANAEALYSLLKNHGSLMPQLYTYTANCLKKAKEYTPDEVIKILTANI